jgi:histone H3/H4
MIDAPNNEDDDTCVPRAAVYKMIKDCTQHIRVSGEAKEMFVQCCNEFIHTLALQANTVCEQQTKKLVHPDHIVTALDNLGFGSYKTNCLNAMETAQEELAQKRRKHHGKLTSIYTDEDLRQQQELLFQQVWVLF